MYSFDRLTVISGVEPKSLESKAGQQLVLTGRGFMSYEFTRPT